MRSQQLVVGTGRPSAVPAEQGSLLVVRVLAGGSVIVQSAIIDVEPEKKWRGGGWHGVLYVPLDAFRMEEIGDLELQLRDGRKHRFVIVGAPFPSHVDIRGFGPCPSEWVL
jgi:hypothetical protein